MITTIPRLEIKDWIINSITKNKIMKRVDFCTESLNLLIE